MTDSEKENQAKEIFIIDPMEKESLCFKEVLIIATKEGDPVGEVSISVKNMSKGFVVHISSQHVYHQFCPEGCSGGGTQMLSITSEVDSTSFSTREEYRHEYSSCACKEKSLYASEIQGECFVSTQAKTCDDIIWDETYDISTDESEILVFEGANIIFLRKLAMTGYSGKIEANAMLINGTVCRCKYEVEHVSAQLHGADGFYQEVVHITRTIYGPRKEPQVLITILTEVGQILQHNWDDSELIMTIDPKNPVLNSRVHSLGGIPLEHMWEEDMMLNSLYLDKVVELKNVFQSYLEDYKEINNIICDFLKELLLGKPEDPVSFAEEYFTDFYDD